MSLTIVALLALIFFRLLKIEQRLTRAFRRWNELATVALYRAPERVAIYINAARSEVKKMNLKDSQQLPMTIAATDKFGNPTGAFDSAPVWSVVDPTLGSLQVSGDGLSASFFPAGKLGTTQVQVAAVADGKSIAGSLDVSVIAGDAVAVLIQPGAPVDVDAAQAQA